MCVCVRVCVCVLCAAAPLRRTWPIPPRSTRGRFRHTSPSRSTTGPPGAAAPAAAASQHLARKNKTKQYINHYTALRVWVRMCACGRTVVLLAVDGRGRSRGGRGSRRAVPTQNADRGRDEVGERWLRTGRRVGRAVGRPERRRGRHRGAAVGRWRRRLSVRTRPIRTCTNISLIN